MTVEQAKKIVLEKFESAHSRQYRDDKSYVILRDYSPLYIPISDRKDTEDNAWLNAAMKIMEQE